MGEVGWVGEGGGGGGQSFQIGIRKDPFPNESGSKKCCALKWKLYPLVKCYFDAAL